MQIKKFKVKDIAEGLKVVRDEMGENALILSTHKLRHGNGIEVVAALDETPVAAPAAPAFSEPEPSHEEAPAAQNYAARMYSQIGGVPQQRTQRANSEASASPPAEEQNDRWQERIAARKESSSHWRFGALPPFLQKLRTAMLIAGIHTEIVDRIIGVLSVDVPQKSFEQAETARSALAGVFQKFVTLAPQPEENEGQRVIAMVGPTGVGKTTSIAKLASLYKFQQNKRVALISIDTFRIAAVEQLRIFAELAEIPLRVAYAPHQLGDLLATLREYEVVLIDTTGRNPKNRVYQRELQQFLEIADPGEVHLVLSATTRYAEQEDIIRSYAKLACNRILLTKIDEVMNPSILLNIQKLTAIPMAFLANGQNIPEDLIIAEKEELGKLMANSWDIEKWIN